MQIPYDLILTKYTSHLKQQQQQQKGEKQNKTNQPTNQPNKQKNTSQTKKKIQPPKSSVAHSLHRSCSSRPDYF